MKNTFLVCFDFMKLREEYNPMDEFTWETAINFMDECSGLRSTLLDTFPNFLTPISIDSFLIKSHLTYAELLEFLVKKFSKNLVDNKHIFQSQIYVAEISNFAFDTYRSKQFEIEYLENLNIQEN